MSNMKNGQSVGLLVLELVIGILLLVDPLKFTSAIITVVGIVLIVFGVFELIRYFRSKPGQMQFVTGLIALLLGIFLAWKSAWIVVVLSSMIFIIYGIFLLIGGLMKLQWTVDVMRLKGNWLSTGISAAISILAAIIIILNPFSTMTVVWRFIAVILIIETVIDLIAVILRNKAREEDIIDI